MSDLHVLAICGSLRARSSNQSLLHAAALLAPEGMRIDFYQGLQGLPHFNPDLDGDHPPAEVTRWRASLHDADAVLISSPEYAHGVPGSLKNALDWIVSSGEFVDKPVVLLNASIAGGSLAQAQLAEILRVMGARVLLEASLVGQAAQPTFDAQGRVEQASVTPVLRQCLQVLAYAQE